MCCARWWVTIGAALAGLAVAAGAFAAHGLESRFAEQYRDAPAKQAAGMEIPASWKYLEDFKTAAQYQMYHALALVAVGLLSRVRPRRTLQVAAWAFLLGIACFSGSLYVLTLTEWTWLGMIVTPSGGVLFLVGWIAFAAGACPCGESPAGPQGSVTA